MVLQRVYEYCMNIDNALGVQIEEALRKGRHDNRTQLQQPSDTAVTQETP